MTKQSLPMRVELPAFIAKKQGLLSLEADVVKVHRETQKSFEVDLAAVFADRASCWRCSRTITNARSRRWGVGPDCAVALGLPYEDGGPEDFPSHGEFNTKRLYLPKSLLSEQEVITLKTYAVRDDTSTEPMLECKVTADENYIHLKSPFVNKKFVDEIKLIPGRDWDFTKKITRFPASDQSMYQLCQTLTRWGMLVNLDSLSETMLRRYDKHVQGASQALENVGVSDISEIKGFDTIDVDSFDWGLKDGITPWKHQAKAILFVASMFGINVPKNKDEE